MPNYSYRCTDCGKTVDRIVSYEDRMTPVACVCGGTSEYVFPFGALKGYLPFESYFDEVLGVDIHGRRERREVMRAMNVREAGDLVGGARNVDKDNAFGIMPEQGVKLSDRQRKEDAARKRKEDTVVAAINKDGTERVYRHGDVGSDIKKTIKARIY